MKPFTYKEIRDSYIQFFLKKQHQEIPNVPLVPENDPSVLFVNAGMFPLVPFLKGESHPKGNRLVNSQRCVRTNDIEQVGNKFHITSFEMLGNWSLNDYFKREAINYTVEFFVRELGLDIDRIYATVYKGDDTIPRDNISIEVWEEIFTKHGVQALVGKGERIETKGREDNWWGLESGGPCGPDSEIFYKTDSGDLVELGNNVFMEYLLEDGVYKSLGSHNVDFGGGLERIAAIVQDADSVYEIDIYQPIMQKTKEISKKEITKSQRIIVDHIKTSVLIIMDGIQPSRNTQGYILRRLIRRSVRHGKLLGITEPFTKEIASECIKQFSQIYPQLEEQKENILTTIEKEEIKFNKTIESGLRELDKILLRGSVDGKKAFQLYETYGLPLEVTEEILNEKGKQLIDRELFHKEEKKHQEQSRTATKGLFKGGLADTSEMTTKYHTATHLLLTALRKVLGDHIHQKGSNITPERLRFDFPSDERLTDEQVQEVENIVNTAIRNKYEVSYEEKTKKEALQIIEEHSGITPFVDRYGDILKIYYIGKKENPFSVEICNGPHVENTKELGAFKIVKQESVAAGIKRIKAILQ